MSPESPLNAGGPGGPDFSPIPKKEGSLKQEEMHFPFGRMKDGHRKTLERLDDPGKLPGAIEAMSAMAIGLPTVQRAVRISRLRELGDGRVAFVREKVSLITDRELMQIFMSPDYATDTRGVGYYARMACDSALLGEGRSMVTERLVGGSYTQEEAVEIASGMVATKQIRDDDATFEEAVKRIKGAVKQSDREVVGILEQKAPHYRGQVNMWRAFVDHQYRAGDEKSASEIFVTAGHATPQGPDWQELFSDEDGRRDLVLRQIYAAGLTYEELSGLKREELLIEGLHYKVAKDADRTLVRGVGDDKKTVNVKVLNRNIYVEGWKSKTFKSWIDALLEKGEGDLLAVYEMWLTAVTTGLVAEVGKGEKGNGSAAFADPPIMSSLDKWLVHFGSVQRAEAGLAEDSSRVRPFVYKNKTGAIKTVGKYPETWLPCFFKNATVRIGNDEKSIFDLWWNEGRNIGRGIDWLSTDRPSVAGGGGDTDEVGINSYDGWLYKKFQLGKFWLASQGVASLRDISGYGYWDGMARTLDKAFGLAWKGLPSGGESRDKVWEKAVEDVGGRPEVLTIEGKQFVQVIPDNQNPRYGLLVGILDRYKPTVVKGEDRGDSSTAFGDEFSILSEAQLMNLLTGKAAQRSHRGEPIERFITSFMDSGMVSQSQMDRALTEVYGDKKKEVIGNSSFLKKMFLS